MRRLSNAASSGAKAYFNKNKEEDKMKSLVAKHRKKGKERKERYIAVTSGKSPARVAKKDNTRDTPGRSEFESKSKNDWREKGYTNHQPKSKACAIM
jgi:hypothetical protein